MLTVFGTRRRRPLPIRKPRGPAHRPAVPEASRRRLTPNQLAVQKLDEALSAYPNAPKSLRQQYANEFVGSEQLRYMNMKTLAGALMFIHNLGPVTELLPEHFSDANLNPILERTIPPEVLAAMGVTQIGITNAPLGDVTPTSKGKLKTEEIAQIRTKHKQSLLRYVRYVILYRIRRREQLEAGVLLPEAEELPLEEPPTEEEGAPELTAEQL